jgi:DNA-binding HxlR family transcriptional regulator
MEKEILKELPACPVETTLTLISDKWKVLILRDLMPGTKRFGELKKSIGHVTQKVLTAQLRQMEESGLLTRKVYAEVPPRVEYTLTELGYSLKPVLDAMRAWGEGYKNRLEGKAVQTVKEFLKKQTSVKRVIFNVFKDMDKKIYERLLRTD